MSVKKNVASQLRKGLVSSAGFTLTSAALMFVLDVLLARNLGPAGFGMFSYVVMVAGMLATLSGLGLHTGIMRFIPEYDASQKWGKLKGAVLFTFFCLLGTTLVVSAAVFVLGRLINIDSVHRVHWSYIALLTVPLAVGIWRRNALRGLHRIRESFLPKDILHPLLISILLIVLNVTAPEGGLMLYGITLIFLEALGVWWVWHYLPAASKNAAATYDALRWLKISIPMVFVAIMQLGLNRWDVLVLGSVSTMTETGLYSAAIRVVLVLSIVSRIIGFVIAPMIASAYHGGRHNDLSHIISKSIMWSGIGVAPLVLLMLIWPGLVLEFFGANFASAGGLLQILVFGQLAQVVSTPLNTFLLMSGREGFLAKLMLLIAGASLLGCITLIPLYGAVAAAWVNSMSLVVLGLVSVLYGRSKLGQIVST
jgi:O-antigen/teichoic acid export membrane protein